MTTLPGTGHPTAHPLAVPAPRVGEPEIAVRAEALTKFYGGWPGRRRDRGVVGLDLEVLRGEVFGFLGPNGAGKTTTIRLLLDLVRPTSGRALVLGHDAHTAALEVRRRTGYLPGDLSLYSRLTGEEHVRYLAALRPGTDLKVAHALADRLDLDLTRPAAALSKGNRQKLGLVLAMQHRPELLVLDEPTSGLDPLVQREFHAMLGEATAAGGTVFLSSHVLSEVERVADRVAVVDEGRLVVVARVDDLKQGAPRELELEFLAEPPVAELRALPMVRDVVAGLHRARVRVQGPVGEVLGVAAAHDLLDVVSHEPELEDIVLDLLAARSAP
ncbi:MAG TPA: ABC transporter ATP-binding protein [Motilibacteraceae bacterium]|nr:ABC transporter ATP-binding protein [Motilibacteraceae bacterium]